MYEPPEDSDARKRAETGPPEDSAARAMVAERERIHAISKAALAPANAMHSLEHVELRKMRQYNPAGFAKHLNAKIVARQQAAGAAATVTDLQKWRSAAPPKPDEPPPRSPPPRSPTRQTETLAKIVTDARGQRSGLGDLLREKLAARFRKAAV
jgi:hypothetical protein